MIFPVALPKEINRPLLAYFKIPIIGPTTDFSLVFNVQQNILVESITAAWDFIGDNQPTMQLISNARQSWMSEPVALCAIGGPGQREPGRYVKTAQIPVNYPYLSSEALIVRIKDSSTIRPDFIDLLLWTRSSKINNPFQGI
jgi:hypothetical protein